MSPIDFEELKKRIEAENAAYHKLISPFVQEFASTNKMSKEQAEKIISYISKDILSIETPKHVATIVFYYIDQFGDIENLLEFLSAQSIIDTGYDLTERKINIFSIKPKEEIAQRISYLKETFEFENEEFIDFICEFPSFMYHKSSYIERRILELQHFFDIDRNTVICLSKSYPFIIGKRLDNVARRIDTLQKYYSVPVNKIKELLLEYPLLMNWGTSNFTENFSAKIFEHHWLIECISGWEGFNFAGYHTFDNLWFVIDSFEHIFGTVEKFIKRDYKEGKFFAVLLRKNVSEYYIVTLGANLINPEKRNQILSNQNNSIWLSTHNYFHKDVPIEKCELASHIEYFCRLNTNQDDAVEEAIYLLFISAIVNKRKYGLKTTSSLYEFSQKNILNNNITNYFFEIQDEEKEIKVKLLSPTIDSDGVVTILPTDY